MVVEVTEINVPNAYVEALIRFKIDAIEDESRNGPVLTCEDPFLLTIVDSTERVLFDPIRDANPFFHLMEFVWMMAGSNDVGWIEQFNKRYRQYADGEIVHGAYGHRWQNHFGMVNQISSCIDILKKDRTSRRAVLGMWDPQYDLEPKNDLPCNTHIYFRVDTENRLNMMICTRSNDLIWGMLGANVVHMTMLFELMCHATGYPMGMYQVFSNNAHIYKNLPKFEEITTTRAPVDYYTEKSIVPMNLLQKNEGVEDLLGDCYEFLKLPTKQMTTRFMTTVVRPMHDAWFIHKIGETEKAIELVKAVEAEDWRLAALEWLQRRVR